ncbi:MAG TPA: DNA polymerase/3'-5' exonuclease PolX [Candidatus Portnoybacteria bacterium]|nr:DNA polymerase/3'-5' exonuclease PolX [Candidatus Portnoybacteria bacterium]
MINLQIAKIFYQMGEYYAMDEVAFKPQAYEKAARLIEGLENDLEDIYKKHGAKGLMEIDGIGQGLAEKIEEYIKNGQIQEYEKLKKACPVDLEHLTAVEGLGPKLIKALYKELKIKTLDDLEKAAQENKIAALPHFGEKSQRNILRGIEYVKGGQGRRLLGSALPIAEHLLEKIKAFPGVEEASLAGSLRRLKETIGDFDFLAQAKNPDKIIDHFCSMMEVEEVLAKGDTKASVMLHAGLKADLRVVAKNSFGAALQYFTGSKDHNIALRKIAEDKGYKLNEYGLFSGKKNMASKTEEEIYDKLGLQYIEPELREDSGEIEAARFAQGKPNGLPKLVQLQDILGDLHTHSTWSDGGYSIKEMALEAKRLGRQYIAMTDHGGNLQVAHALNDKKDILAQWAEIDELNKELEGIKILKGIEVDINGEGEPELPNELLAQFDIVLASAHLKLRLPEKEQTERMIRAMQNPHIDILAHPTGRKILDREPMALDMEEIFKVAAATGTVLEISTFPERLDLKDVYIRQAIKAEVKLSLGTDAHILSHLLFMELGVSQARRGWAEKKDIINCLSWAELLKLLNQ